MFTSKLIIRGSVAFLGVALLAADAWGQGGQGGGGNQPPVFGGFGPGVRLRRADMLRSPVVQTPVNGEPHANSRTRAPVVQGQAQQQGQTQGQTQGGFQGGQGGFGGAGGAFGGGQVGQFSGAFGGIGGSLGGGGGGAVGQIGGKFFGFGGGELLPSTQSGLHNGFGFYGGAPAMDGVNLNRTPTKAKTSAKTSPAKPDQVNQADAEGYDVASQPAARLTNSSRKGRAQGRRRVTPTAA